MSSSTLQILVLMVVLYILAEISNLVFKIHSNKYYSIFHFVGGALSYLLFFSIFNSKMISFIGVFVIGVSWEVHELLIWKHVFKKKLYKPERKDTLNDIIVDISGALVVMVVF